MRLEQSEQLLVQNLFKKSNLSLKQSLGEIKNISRLTGDASTRRYYRIESANNSYVACLGDPTGKAEINFITLQNVYNENKVRVPKIYDKNLEMGYILEEDLGNQTLLYKLASSDSLEERDLYIKSIEELIKIHLIDVSKYDAENFTKNSFDQQKLLYEVNFTLEYFIKNFLEHRITKKQQEVLSEGFSDLCKNLDSDYKVLTHRDYHSRNIMIKNNDLVLIDFQDSRMGIPQYDLVSILEDCYYSLNNDNKDFLIEFYWNNFLNEKSEQTREEFYKLYDLMTIQRVFKAIGSFSYIYDLRKDKRYLKYIGYAFEKIRTLLDRYPEYKDLKKSLCEIYYAN